MRVFLLELEPLEERYTEQWSRWIPDALKKRGHEPIVIKGKSLCSSIKSGAFLDVHSSNYHRFSQLMKLVEMFYDGKVVDGDVIWSYDFYHPGLEAIKYISDLTDVKIILVANYHACSVTTEDFIQPLSRWSRFFERGWASICDAVFFQTKYALNKFIREREHNYPNTHVVGNPFSSSDIKSLVPTFNKENKVIFPNRWDYEKRPNLFLEIARIVKQERPDTDIVVTTSRPKFRSVHPWLEKIGRIAEKEGLITIKDGLTKKQYYEELATSKVMVSTSIEENWGYCVTESAVFHTIPICPNNYSYRELLPPEYLYGTIDESVTKIIEILDGKTPDLSGLDYLVEYADSTLDNIIDIIEMHAG